MGPYAAVYGPLASPTDHSPATCSHGAQAIPPPALSSMYQPRQPDSVLSSSAGAYGGDAERPVSAPPLVAGGDADMAFQRGPPGGGGHGVAAADAGMSLLLRQPTPPSTVDTSCANPAFHARKTSDGQPSLAKPALQPTAAAPVAIRLPMESAVVDGSAPAGPLPEQGFRTSHGRRAPSRELQKKVRRPQAVLSCFPTASLRVRLVQCIVLVTALHMLMCYVTARIAWCTSDPGFWRRRASTATAVLQHGSWLVRQLCPQQPSDHISSSTRTETSNKVCFWMQAHGLALAAVKAALKPHLRPGGLDRAAFRAAAEAATKVCGLA